MLSPNKPKNFHSRLQVSTVFIECQGKLLLLQRANHISSPNLWVIPGGKLENEETPLEGLLREIAEELNLHPSPKDLQYIDSLYVQRPLFEYRLHLFKWELGSFPTIALNPKEHQAYIWQPIEQFQDLALLEGQLEVFHFVYDMKSHQ
jgi:8-oxo-dGTP diphosphatase